MNLNTTPNNNIEVYYMNRTLNIITNAHDRLTKKEKQKIKESLGVRTDQQLINTAKSFGINVGVRPQTQLKRAYLNGIDFYNNDYVPMINDIIIQQRAERKKAQKKQKIMGNTVVRDYTNVLPPDRVETFYNDIKSLHQEGRTINVVKEGGVGIDEEGRDFNVNFSFTFTSRLSRNFQTIFTAYLQIQPSPDDKITNDPEPFKIYINVGEKVSGNKIIQAFKHGITNCFFKPIIEWAENTLLNAQSKRTKERYSGMLKKLKKDNDAYFETGVSEEDIPILSNKYQINIEVNTPFQETFIIAKSDKKALTTFRFINTRIDHIDHNKVVNLKAQEIGQKEINKMGEELKKEKTYFTYNKNKWGYSKISTLEASYVVNNTYRECVDKFENETGICDCYIDDITDVDLSEFIRQGVHYTNTIDFKDDIFTGESDELDLDEDYSYEYTFNILNDKYKNFKHIDMKKAYSNFHLCKYYKGFLGKPTDLRKCDKIVDLGYYLIKNINFDNANPKFVKYNDYLRIYTNDEDGNVFPSPELDFLKDNGVSFDIVAGCWGTNIDFRFNEEMLKSRKELGEPSYYARWTGAVNSNELYSNFYVGGDRNLAQHLKYEGNYDIVNYNDFTNEIQVSYKKKHNNHLSHITGFITGYMRLNVLEQLLNMDINNILKVVVDGIYFINEEPELYSSFVYEDREKIVENTSGESYISNDEYDLKIEFNDFRPHFKTELHKGVGGSGKTHLNIYDNGLQKKLFVAPSWKLSRDKNRESGITNNVWANLLSDDVEKINYFKRNFNVMIIDEISMMTDKAKEKIMNTYKNIKLIFCGDPNYQLPQFEKNQKNINVKKGFDNTITYTENKRCKCFNLLEILNYSRYMIEQKIKGDYCFTHKKWFIANTLGKIQAITKNQLKEIYNVNDMILTRTLKERDNYTELLKNHKKYYILKTDRIYCKGQIVINKPNENYVEGVDYEQRNAYTIHSIQGETAKNKLFIDNPNMNIEETAVYTALSRAEYLNQIYLIVDNVKEWKKKVNDMLPFDGD